MIAATSPAVRSLIAASRIAVAALRWSGRMSRIASPSRGARRVRPDEPFVRLEREDGRCTLGVVEPVEPGSDRGRDLLGGRRHRASPAARCVQAVEDQAR